LGHFTGTLCDIPYENCADGSQCFYGGVCREKEGTIPIYYCECPPTHGGVGCQDEILSVEINEEKRQVRTNAAVSLKYISLGIVIAITTFFGVGLIMMRRRRKKNERRYHAIQASDDFRDGIEARNLNKKQEHWRNVV
jgi:hypothetical protein